MNDPSGRRLVEALGREVVLGPQLLGIPFLRDFEDFARGFAGIGKAQAITIWRGDHASIVVTVAAASAEEDSPLIGNLVALVSPGRALAIPTEKGHVSYWMLAKNVIAALVPFMLVFGTMWLVWWYVVINQQAVPEEAVSGLQQLGTPGLGTGPKTAAELGPPEGFYAWFWGITAVLALWQLRYYWRLDVDRLEGAAADARRAGTAAA